MTILPKQLRSGKTRVFALALVVLVAGSIPSYGETRTEKHYVSVALNLSLAPGLSSASLVRAVTGNEVATRFSYGLIASSHARVHGLAVSSLWNAHDHGVHGVQIAALVNSTDTLDGVQLSGLVNRAGGVKGVQVAGIVNVADTVNGVQVGLVNVSRRSSGIPIGLVSYARDYGVALETWTDETGTASIALRSGNDRVANFFGAGYNPFAPEYPWSLIAGIGLEQPLTRPLLITGDLITASVFSETLLSAGLRGTVRGRLGLRLGERTHLFAGVGGSLFLAHPGTGYRPQSLLNELLGGGRGAEGESALVTFWPSATLGMRVGPFRGGRL